MLDIFQSPTPVSVEADDATYNITLAGNEYPVSRKLHDVVSKVEKGSIVEWVSNGDWSMHELLFALLELTGPAEVFISSYAFSERPARVIADLVNDKVINPLHCLIDSRVDTRSASALTMIQNCSQKCKLLDTHAKVTVIYNAARQIVVIGSANYTTNHRYECGVIIENYASSLYHIKWIKEALYGDE